MCRKRVVITYIISFIIIIIIIVGITIAMHEPVHEITFPEHYKVGLISSASVGVGTDILFLDEDLKKVGEVNDLQYAAFALSPQTPVIKDRILYTSPMGEMTKRDTHITVAMNLESGEIKEYDNGKHLESPTSTAVNDRAIYVCSNGNGVSTVARHDLKTDKLITRDFDGTREGIIMTVLATDNHVYCSGDVIAEENTYLYILDPDTLETQNRIELEDDSLYMREWEGEIYLCSSFKDHKRDSIGIIDDVTGKCRTVEMSGKNKLGIEKFGDFLVAADNNGNGKKSQLIVYNTKNNKEETIHFGGEIFQTWMVGNELYIDSLPDDGISVLTVMRLESGKLKQVKKKQLEEFVITGFYVYS